MEKRYTFTVETEDVGDRLGRTLKVVATYGNHSYTLPVLFREELIDLKNTIENFLKDE
jgi:hypothetical protein